MINEAALAIFQQMVLKIAPLYLVMGLGFLLGRARPAAAEPLSFLQIYFVVPIVMISSIANLSFEKNFLVER